MIKKIWVSRKVIKDCFYSITFIDLCTWSVKTYDEIKCAPEILWEMTYHGTADKIRKEPLKDIS